jgi:uridine monophosphate synthetase
MAVPKESGAPEDKSVSLRDAATGRVGDAQEKEAGRAGGSPCPDHGGTAGGRKRLRTLLTIARAKETNLILSADEACPAALLALIDAAGPHVCAVKLHLDLIEFGAMTMTRKAFATEIERLKAAHVFLVIEDRKFADIGEIALKQLSRLPRFVDMVTVHALSGKDALQAMDAAELGLLVVVQMSCANNLLDQAYTKRALEFLPGLANLVGVIGQSRQANYLTLTPGVHLEAAGGAAGQRYSPPSGLRGDLFIVGTGIAQAADRAEAARAYRHACWPHLASARLLSML